MQPQQGNGTSTSPVDDMQHNLNLKSTTASPLMKFPSLPSSLHDLKTSSQHFHQMQPNFDHAPQPAHDDFLEQMLSTLNSASAWDNLKAAGESSASPEESENGVSAADFQFDEAVVASKLRAQHQQQQMLPLPFDVDDLIDRNRGSLLEGSSFDSFHPGVENQMAGLFNGSFVGSLLGQGPQINLPEHYQSSQQGGPSFEAPAAMNNQAPMSSSAGAAAAPPKQRVRARRGQATDPHSIAERLRRERIAERMKGLQGFERRFINWNGPEDDVNSGEYHPDVCKGSNSKVQFQSINEAYDVVMSSLREESIENEVCRPLYDDEVADENEGMREMFDPDYDLWEEWMGWEGAGIRDYSSHINPYI
uniref:Uncharacterized protein n=1 Tax=Kalanchoe fedtschenkoi TaxID=63787 RepID=A0A7N0TWD4_KALFE